MTYKTTEYVSLETGNGHELHLELDVTWQGAEPDVGIMGDYVDDFAITAVNGKTRHAKWVDAIITKNELTNDIIERIYDAQ